MHLGVQYSGTEKHRSFRGTAAETYYIDLND